MSIVEAKNFEIINNTVLTIVMNEFLKQKTKIIIIIINIIINIIRKKKI